MFFHFSKPRISECKESLLALPSGSGFVKTKLRFDNASSSKSRVVSQNVIPRGMR